MMTGATRQQKSSKMEEDITEIKKSLEKLTVCSTKMAEQQTELTQLLEEVKTLKIQVRERDQTILELESRVHDLEQYTRKDDVIITGIKTKARSYSRAVVRQGQVEEDDPTEDHQSLEMQVTHFLRSKNIDLDPEHLSACHTLPRKDGGAPAIIIRFANRKHKTELLSQGKKLKGTNVYMNEHLTRKNATIAKEARYLRKQQRIQGTWTRNCNVYIRLNGSAEEAKVIKVRDLSDLEPYK